MMRNFRRNNSSSKTTQWLQRLSHSIQQQQQQRTHYSYNGPGQYTRTLPVRERLWKERNFSERGFTVGIGGPVGSGKTALVLALCQNMPSRIAGVGECSIRNYRGHK